MGNCTWMAAQRAAANGLLRAASQPACAAADIRSVQVHVAKRRRRPLARAQQLRRRWAGGRRRARLSNGLSNFERPFAGAQWARARTTRARCAPVRPLDAPISAQPRRSTWRAPSVSSGRLSAARCFQPPRAPRLAQERRRRATCCRLNFGYLLRRRGWCVALARGGGGVSQRGGCETRARSACAPRSALAARHSFAFAASARVLLLVHMWCMIANQRRMFVRRNNIKNDSSRCF